MIEALTNELPIELVGASILGVLTALLVGHLWGRSGRESARCELREAQASLTSIEADAKDYHRTVARMRSELGTVANLAMSLPHVVRDMNRNDLDPAEVPRLIFQLANAIFQPEQVLLYGVRSVQGPNGQRRQLQLIGHRGIGSVADEVKTVEMGEGKVGWVAHHELDMVPEDWDKLAQTERTRVAENHPALKADIIGPLVHHAKDAQQLLGVLCLGRPKIKPRDEKLMFQMVTNIGSLALVNSWNMKKLKSMANHDGLTGLYNKRCFLQDMGAKMLIACEKKAAPFSIFIFDIDHFKNYNDTNGHPAGDDLLRRMGKLIKDGVRAADVACRYGGEEFVVGLPETDKETAYRLADELRQTISDTLFDHREKQPLGHVSISGGVATFPADGSSVGELLQKADEALYRSKKGGRNRIARYRGLEIGSGEPDPLVSVDPAGAAGSGDLAGTASA